MPASVVLGAQWGDEGKGKAIDQLAADSTWAVRFQGGNNAGHTIVLGDTTLKLHQIPSGVTSPNCNLILGDGMVIDLPHIHLLIGFIPPCVSHITLILSTKSFRL